MNAVNSVSGVNTVTTVNTECGVNAVNAVNGVNTPHGRGADGRPPLDKLTAAGRSWQRPSPAVVLAPLHGSDASLYRRGDAVR